MECVVRHAWNAKRITLKNYITVNMENSEVYANSAGVKEYVSTIVRNVDVKIARGLACANTVSLNITARYAVVEVSVNIANSAQGASYVEVALYVNMDGNEQSVCRAEAQVSANIKLKGRIVRNADPPAI
jgi:hypothetical protein